MSYGNTEVQQALRSISEGTASFDTRAYLEHYLLALLRDHGTAGVAGLLDSLPGCNHASSGDNDNVRFAVRGFGAPLVITTCLSADFASVNVVLEDSAGVRVEPDPRHHAFYDIWESLLGLPDSEVKRLDPRRLTVFLVALLEAEVMNGGLGQYLTNTDGTHLEATRECLLLIGAVRTAELLQAAAQLGAGFRSYAAAWEADSAAFASLDQRFLDSGEDLAGLTADALQLGAG